MLKRVVALAAVAGAAVVAAGLGVQPVTERADKAATPSPQPGVTGPMVLERSPTRVLADRIAKKIVAASPVADPADAAARDAAAEELAACDELVNAADGKVLWGGFHPEQGYDPANYRLTRESPLDHFQLTEFDPMVWAKLYLSTFMFTGVYEVREEGRFTVLDLEAKFRGGLAPGEYPYPFWHSPNKWTAYMNSQRVLMVFERGRLLAAMRKSPPPESLRLIRRPWDAKWSWTDANGEPQPRVALFDYLFSKENPHVGPLEASYRALEEKFRAQNCMTCHQPDNRSKLNDLLLLNYPNQSLVMRRTIVATFEENYMPPGDPIAGEKEGVQDPHELAELLRLAKEFERHADRAMSFEREHKAATPTP